MEHAFNTAAGFTEEDDNLPAFFYAEALPPNGKVARLFAGEVKARLLEMLERDTRQGG